MGKDPVPFGWDVLNQKSLWNAYNKWTRNSHIHEASNVRRHQKISAEKIYKMEKELKDQDRITVHLAGGEGSMKMRILTQSMTVMNISTRRLSEPLVNIH